MTGHDPHVLAVTAAAVEAAAAAASAASATAVLAVKLDAHKEQLDRIEEQTQATNGRVRTIEKWKERIMGAWVVASVCGPVITGLILKFV